MAEQFGGIGSSSSLESLLGADDGLDNGIGITPGQLPTSRNS
jgi:hypothetical protein